MISLTFDTDWVQPDDLDRFLNEFGFPGTGTFFLHRPYVALRSTHHELCPHPFPVGPTQWKDSIHKLLDELELQPSGVRTHSCAHSHMLEFALYELGFTYTSNSSRLFSHAIEPCRLAWGLWEMPIYYMDNLDLTAAQYWPNASHQPFATHVIRQAIYEDGIYVFDFHPLHVSLNTPNLEYYLAKQAQLKAGTSPFELRYEGRGVGTFFKELCGAMVAGGKASLSLKEMLGVTGLREASRL